MRELAPRIVEYEIGDVTKRVEKDYGGTVPIEIVFHDESTFQAHDGSSKVWVLDNQHKLRKKGAGRGVHRSDFIGPSKGWMREAGHGMHYGKGYDGYWTGEDVCKQVRLLSTLTRSPFSLQFLVTEKLSSVAPRESYSCLCP